MLAEFLYAFVLAGVPVGAMSYLLIWWALRSEYFERESNLKQFEKAVKKVSKDREAEKKRVKKEGGTVSSPRFTPVHNKWLKFGGGFYGVVALMTFALIELGEIRDFFAGFSENVSRLSQLNFDLLINLLVDSLMNFFMAMAWPWYWMQQNLEGEFWIWFLAAYAGYWLGARAALIGPTAPESGH